jgi:hypothetical protein
MTDQIRNLVEQGKLLNYDACFQDSNVINIARQNPVKNDDLNNSLAIDNICKIYYKNPFWRGGINPSSDDRMTYISASGWDSTKSDTIMATVHNLKTDFTNNINILTNQSNNYKFNGQRIDLNNIADVKNNLENIISKMRQQKENLEVIYSSLQKENSVDVLQNISNIENKIKQLTKENEYYIKGKELRKEQTKDLYTRFDSNYHSSGFGQYFGYKPISAVSQPVLLFISFFMAFVGLIILGFQIGPDFIERMKGGVHSIVSKNIKHIEYIQPNVQKMNIARY